MELLDQSPETGISIPTVAKQIQQLFMETAVANAPAPTPVRNYYGGQGNASQTGDDPTAILDGADRRGFHENFGKQTHDNIGRFDAPEAGVVSADYSLADSIGIGATVLTEVSIGLAVGFLTWGAIRLAMAAGDEEQVEHAKAIMKWAIAGLVLGLIAFSIVSMVTNAVNNA